MLGVLMSVVCVRFFLFFFVFLFVCVCDALCDVRCLSVLLVVCCMCVVDCWLLLVAAYWFPLVVNCLPFVVCCPVLFGMCLLLVLCVVCCW